jgi:opacity protein-like surface antigen
MKRTALLVLCTIFITPSLARADDAAKFEIGAQGGPAFTNFQVSSPLTSQVSNPNGWVGGLYLELGFPFLTLRPEANYVTKGFQLNNVAKVENHYFEVPVLLKFNPFGNFLVSPFLLVGVAWSWYLNSDVTLLGGTTGYTNSADRPDFTGVAAAGAEVNLTEHFILSAQLRYNLGLRTIDNTNNVKTRAWYALAGLGVPF